MELHFASVWETIADLVGDREAVVCGDTRRTWAEYDDRAARIASALGAYGIGADSKVGIYLHNSTHYLEAQYGIFKVRGVPVNVTNILSSPSAVGLKSCISAAVRGIGVGMPTWPWFSSSVSDPLTEVS